MTIVTLFHIWRQSMFPIHYRGATLHHIRLLTLAVLHFVATVELAKISLEPQKIRLFFDRPPPAKRCPLPPPLRLHLLSDGHAIRNISDDNYHRRRFVPGSNMRFKPKIKSSFLPSSNVRTWQTKSTSSTSPKFFEGIEQILYTVCSTVWTLLTSDDSLKQQNFESILTLNILA